MLCITRKKREEVVIVLPNNEKIIITIRSLDGGRRVHMGFLANDTIKIFRKELYQRMQDQCTE